MVQALSRAQNRRTTHRSENGPRTSGKHPSHRLDRRLPSSGRRIVSLLATLALPVAALFALTASTSSTAAVDTTQPAATSSHPTFFGTTLYTSGGESLADAYQRQTRSYGQLGIVRLFYGAVPASWSSIESAVHHTRVLVSFHDSPSAILSGSMDSQFRAWFNSAPTNVVTRWTYYHEPEDDAEAGQLNLADYRAAWRHLSTLADQAHNPKLRATLVLMCWTLSPHSGRQFSDYYAGSDYIDVVAFDCYNGGHRANRYRPPANQLRPIKALANQIHKNWGIAELGSVVVAGDNGSGRAQWLKDAGSFAHTNGARFVSYFDSDMGVDYRLHDTPSKTAWRSLVQSSR